MDHNSFDTDNELITKQSDWVRLFDLPGVVEQITDSPCGGEGTCGKCRVLVLAGECQPPTAEENIWLNAVELEQGIRLACFCRIKGNIKLRFPKKAVPQILLNTPGKNCNTKDNRIFNRINAPRQYGIAIDLGTTTIVSSLFDLATGKELHVSATLNPQSSYGLDVMSRINYSSRDGGTEKLQCLLIDRLVEMICECCANAGMVASDIQEIAVAGNTIMLHILAGVDPSAMGRFPYTPVFTSAIRVPAAQLGMHSLTAAEVYIMPSVSAFIGADTVAGILATGLEQETGNTLLLDLGTNGELVLCSNHQLWACSVAMGPALEGMNIECGMRAENGAVDKVWIEDNKLCLHVIGEGEAIGLCGTGLLDTVGALVKAGIVAKNGRLLMENKPDRFADWSDSITESKQGRRFWLRHPLERENGLYISQNDIRNLQLAKGAVCAGIKLLLDAAGIKTDQVQKINLSGALGNYINPDVLIELGFFPPEWRDKVIPLGNSALKGAIMALMSPANRARALHISQQIKCLDLTSSQEFQYLFPRSMSLSADSWSSAQK